MASDPTPRFVTFRDDWTKHIPLALLLALIVQSTAVVWWASNLTAREQTLETAVNTIAANGSPPLQVRVSQLETQMRAEHDATTRMQSELDQHMANDAERFRSRP